MDRFYDSSGSRSRKSRVQKQIDRYMESIGKKTPSPSPTSKGNNKRYERELFSDKKAIHNIFNNLKALCKDLNIKEKNKGVGSARKQPRVPPGVQTMSTKESPEVPPFLQNSKQISPVRINLMPKLNLSAIKQQDSSEDEEEGHPTFPANYNQRVQQQKVASNINNQQQRGHIR